MHATQRQLHAMVVRLALPLLMCGCCPAQRCCPNVRCIASMKWFGERAIQGLRLRNQRHNTMQRAAHSAAKLLLSARCAGVPSTLSASRSVSTSSSMGAGDLGSLKGFKDAEKARGQADHHGRNRGPDTHPMHACTGAAQLRHGRGALIACTRAHGGCVAAPRRALPPPHARTPGACTQGIEDLYFTKEDQRMLGKLLTKVKNQSELADVHGAAGTKAAELSVLKPLITKYNIDNADVEVGWVGRMGSGWWVGG
jgi:hypothetical protein